MEDNINNICKRHVKATSPLCRDNYRPVCRGSYSILQRQLLHCAEAATPLCRGSSVCRGSYSTVQRKLDRCAEAESVESLKQLQQVQSLG
jgi:hypothetical protein